MLLSLIKAKGHSMEPTILDGSFFVASSIPLMFRKPGVNELVVIDYNNKLLIKRIVKVDGDILNLRGDNFIDSLNLKDIKKDQIKAKVIWIF